MAYAIFAAFCTYFCMYAFRKPFSAAAYGDATVMLPVIGKTLDLKTVFVIAQITAFFVEGGYEAMAVNIRRRKQLKRMKDHVIVCGGGREGSRYWTVSSFPRIRPRSHSLCRPASLL